MLACDLMVEVRASRSLNGDQVAKIERMVFAAGNPSHDQLELLFLIDTYLERSDPSWGALLDRAADAALGQKPPGAKRAQAAEPARAAA